MISARLLETIIAGHEIVCGCDGQGLLRGACLESRLATDLLAAQEALQILWDYSGQSLRNEGKQFSCVEFDERWGTSDATATELVEDKVRAILEGGE